MRRAVPARVLPPTLPIPIRPVVAYLTNAYPRPSHSFIRREILALERQCFQVHRFSIRPLAGDLPDPEDQREATRTHILLDGRMAHLAGSFVAMALARPRRVLGAVGVLLAMCRSPADLPRHIAYLVEACRLVHHLEAAGIRHIHCHFGTNPAAVARLAHRIGGLTYSFTVHGPDEFDAPIGLSLAAKASEAAFVVTISSYGRGQLMRWLTPADWPRIEVVRCGVDAKFQVAMPSPIAEPGLASQRLLCIARLNAQKGLPLLIEAARQLAGRRQFELRIIGGGELHAELQAGITAAGLDDHVRLLGPQASDIVRSELLAARALVSASLAEGLPVVMMEALGLGRPVIATSIAGVPELVDGTCGWLVPSGSAEELAKAMAAALDATPATLAAMGEEGRRRVRAAHDADTNARQLAALLRPLTRPPAAG